MEQNIDIPDWEAISSCGDISPELSNKFLQETINNNIHFYWEKIVNNRNLDNSEIVNIWEKVCRTNAMKEDFVNWYSQQTHFKAQGPYYSYKDVLRYLTHKKHSLDNTL